MLAVQINLNASEVSKERLDFMIKQFRKLGEDTTLTLAQRDELQTLFSEMYSAQLKIEKGIELNPGELLVYDAKEIPQVELDDGTFGSIEYGGMRKMVDISKFKAKDFNETETINGDNCPEGPLKITRADEVKITTGPRANEEALVLELDGKYTYWPNRTSVKNLATKLGDESDGWIGKTITLTTEKTMVRGAKKNVIYAEAK